MTVETNKALIRRYLDAIRQDKSPATLNRFITEDDLKQHVAVYEESFPGYGIDEEDMIAEGDRVMLRGTVRGIHSRALMDIAPTGIEVSVPLFIIYRIADDKIVEHWMLVDMPALLDQLAKAPAASHV
jgi:predicted ester cyclase